VYSELVECVIKYTEELRRLKYMHMRCAQKALFEGCLCYHLRVVCRISDDVCHCLKFSFNSNFEFGNRKSWEKRGQVNREVVEE
jgi:hypothetical protein